MTDYICLGVPYFIGERITGRDEIDKLRESGFAESIGAVWIDVQPDFSADVHPVVAVNRAIAQTIGQHPGKTPLIFASCCTSVLGAMKGLEAQNPAVVWFDAHGDFNTAETTPSGFLGGMPLAWLVGDDGDSFMAGVGLKPIAEADITLTDARDLDPPEAVRLQNSAVRHLPDVADLLNAELPNKPIYVHMDTDVVRLDDMPGMSYPAEGGPTLAAVIEVVQRIAREGQIAGVLFSVWNDRLPTDGKSFEATLQLAKAFTTP